MTQRPTIMAVVVLYKKTIEQSRTLQRLRDMPQHDQPQELLIWDNSPCEAEQISGANREGFLNAISLRLISCPRNPGLAEAYNHACELAEESGIDWILTLDQDTDLPANYLFALSTAISENHDDGVVCFCPQALQRSKQFSPIRMRLEFPFPTSIVSASGVSERPITAVNSGLCVRRSFLSEIGGYSAEFPLDYLDHWLCREIYRRGKRISVLPIEIEHELSLHDFTRSVTVERYRGILSAQRRFFATSQSFFSRFLYAIAMLRHALGKSFSGVGNQYVSIAWREAYRSLRLCCGLG